MATALMGTMNGARCFSGAGSLCVDDLFSGVQLVLDMEIVEYVREVIESFDPHPDILSTDNLYENIEKVCRGEDIFLSCDDTVQKFRNILPSSNRIVRDKLPSWRQHNKRLVDRAREEAIERIRTQPDFRISEDKQRELNRIYARAEADLAGFKETIRLT